MALSSSSSAPNTTMTPTSSAGESPIIDAWKQAVERYKKSLPEKDQKKIQMSTGPKDVVKDIEEWQQRQSRRKSIKVATVVGNGLHRLQRFTATIDMLAQGSPAPGCLLWGSIKFVLKIVKDAVDEYEKLCTALNRMVECLPWIEIYEKTFVDSALVHGCVVDFYESAIHFWIQACKSYRRYRLWKMGRKIWEDYDTEFSLLETKMFNCEKKIMENAAAEHMRQAKSARAGQQTVNESLLNTQSSSRKKELTRWLSPMAHEVKYYQEDFKAAIRKRHPDSCQWLFSNAQFMQFSESQVEQAPLLWIYANPGAGKTVLSSFLIDHYQHQKTNNIIYFFCKNSDEDKNTPASIIRSLLYQVLEIIEGPGYCGTLSGDMEASMTKSGQHRALEFNTMWSLFAEHIREMDQPIVILDALDECEERGMLTRNLRALSRSHGVRVIITSRMEIDIHKILNEELSVEIRSEDVDADIKAFIKAKVSKTPLLCQNSIHDMIVDDLCASHGGMFLWVYLVLKELKVCKFVQQVQKTLKKLPRGLDGIYENILQRLCKTLKSPLLELAKKVLVWVVSASRPLRVKEIQEALRFHYHLDGYQPIADEQSFPYADKDIEIACGSLLMIRGGTVQVIHLTVKEFLMDLTSSTNESYKQLLVDPTAASLEPTLVCLDYISQRLRAPISNLDAKTNPMDMEVDDMRLQDRLEQNPFIEYASLNWPLHCIDYEGDCSTEIAKAIKKTFDSSVTFYWIEICLLLDSSSFLRSICSGLEELIEWASDELDRAPPDSADLYEFLSNWCSVVVRIVHDYGECIARLPWDVYTLDMRGIFVSKGLGKLYNNHGKFETRDLVTYFSDEYNSNTSPTVPNHLQIPTNDSVGFFVHDHTRKVFIIARAYPFETPETLYIQEVGTGRRLPPVSDAVDQYMILKSYATSVNGEYLCILYLQPGPRPLRISIWQLDSKIEFKKTMRSEPWARKVFSEESEESFPNTDLNTSIGYRDDGYFYTPIGRIQPATGIIRRFPPEILPSVINPASWGDWWTVCFGVKGELFVHKMQTQLLNVYSLQEPYPAENHSPLAANFEIIQTSPTGRYLLLKSEVDDFFQRENFFQWENPEWVYGLYNTTSKELFKVKRGKRGLTACFAFSKDDNQLFYVGLYNYKPRRIDALVFALHDGEPQLCSEAQVGLDGVRDSGMLMNVYCNENTAWIIARINKEQRIYQVDLGPPKIIFHPDLITALNGPSNLSCHSRFSHDGTKLSVLHYGDYKAQVQTFDLNNPGNPVHCLDLNWPHCDTSGLYIAFSKDLSVLVCGERLFHLAAKDRIASESFPIFSPTPGQEQFCYVGCNRSHYSSSDKPPIFVSDDNPFIAYVPFVVRGKPPLVHKVNLRSRCSVQLDIPSINDISMVHADFHPSLPLMLLFHRGRSTNTSVVDVSTLDLNDLNVNRLPISRRYRRLDLGGNGPFIRFSNCGTSIIWIGYDSGPKVVPLGNLQIEPVPIRKLGPGETLFHGGCYSLTEQGPGNVGIQFLSSSSPNTREVNSGSFISFPSNLSWHNVRLLLGPTDDELIRVLLLSNNRQPLEIRTIKLTFSELRARMIHKWERKYNEPFRIETVEVHPDAATAYVMERPDGSSSVDLSPSDLITLHPDQDSSEDDITSNNDVFSGESEAENYLENTAEDRNFFTWETRAEDFSEDGPTSDDNVSTGETEAKVS